MNATYLRLEAVRLLRNKRVVIFSTLMPAFLVLIIGGVSVGTVMKTIWPFYGALIAALMLVTYVPAFSMFLPELFFK